MDAKIFKEDSNFLSEETVEIFIRANILRSIDRELLRMNYDDITVKCNKVEKVYKVTLSVPAREAKKGFVTMFDFSSTKDDKMQIRRMMGVTMQILDTLLSYTRNEKIPVIKVVK